MIHFVMYIWNHYIIIFIKIYSFYILYRVFDKYVFLKLEIFWWKKLSFRKSLDLVKFVMCALVSRVRMMFYTLRKGYTVPGNQGIHDKLNQIQIIYLRLVCVSARMPRSVDKMLLTPSLAWTWGWEHYSILNGCFHG